KTSFQNSEGVRGDIEVSTKRPIPPVDPFPGHVLDAVQTVKNGVTAMLCHESASLLSICSRPEPKIQNDVGPKSEAACPHSLHHCKNATSILGKVLLRRIIPVELAHPFIVGEAKSLFFLLQTLCERCLPSTEETMEQEGFWLLIH